MKVLHSQDGKMMYDETPDDPTKLINVSDEKYWFRILVFNTSEANNKYVLLLSFSALCIGLVLGKVVADSPRSVCRKCQSLS